MRPNTTRATVAALAAALLVGSVVGAGAFATFGPSGGSDGANAEPTDPEATDDRTTDPPNRSVGIDTDVGTFDSTEAFRDYLLAGQRSGAGAVAAAGRTVRDGDAGGDGDDVEVVEEDAAESAHDAEPSRTAAPDDAGADRVEDTNVQVEGIDEPDLAKADGERAFFARGTEPRRGSTTYRGVAVLDIADPAAPEVAGHVNDRGQLLLVGDTLVVLSDEAVRGYDVADPDDPERLWSRPVEGRVSAARLVDGRLYLVTEERIDFDEPCPVEPLGGDDSAVACEAVHRPAEPIPARSTRTVSLLDPDDGTVHDAVSFVGGADTTVAAFGDSVYVTTVAEADRGELYLDFLLTEYRDELPADVVERLETVRDYDLSPRAQRAETDATLDRWFATLDRDERRTARENLREAWRDYREAHKRDLARTTVVRVDATDGDATDGAATGDDADGPALDVAAVGSVPGRPLDQFSMDEHDGHLRIATTVGDRAATTENDVYVLDGDLEIAGSATGMGETERVYAVRFVGDTGYVVTFRQIDPFYVLDLSDLADPTVEGELKLPGFSSYLHPLGDGRVLGVGEEDRQVKAVIFDASDPQNPTIEDDYVLSSEHWNAVRESHHAFHIDRRHGVFFLPGRNGGYVFDYEDGLELRTTVDVEDTRRAIVLDDYLYVFAEDELVVVNEATWERETTVDLRESGS